MKVDHEQFALFNYENVLDVKDKFKLGDVVYNPHLDEVGVIIQTHGNNEYRTDMFGNCSYDEVCGDIKRARTITILKLRPSLFD